jgi:predicted short-subunit dehydrogenase-like oxidoreductase (DUF2520 family)
MHLPDDTGCHLRLAIVGNGRLGSAFARALRGNVPEVELVGPLGRGADPRGYDAVLLCVPDAEIASAAAAITPGPLVGHCSGATGLEPLAPHEAFSLHPLMTITATEATFNGAAAAIDGNTERAAALAGYLAGELGLEPIRVRPADRAAYHAAASMASNFLVTLEAAAEQLAATAGVERKMLVPLVRATVENWATVGGERALTGPVARGDVATVARQRDAVSERAPELLTLFDALTEATRELASRPELEPA